MEKEIKHYTLSALTRTIPINALKPKAASQAPIQININLKNISNPKIITTTMMNNLSISKDNKIDIEFDFRANDKTQRRKLTVRIFNINHE